MGFNISGLVINQNYRNNFEELQSKLGWNLKKQEDIIFETASSNWTEEDACKVYFSEKGTLIFLSMDMCVESWALKDNNTLTFALSETSMAFNMVYCENGVDKRTIMEVEGERMTDEGEILEVEAKSEDISDIIFNQIGEVLGKSFWSIDLSEKAEHYLFVKPKDISFGDKNEIPAESEPEQISTTDAQKAPAGRKWWQFWK